MQKELQEKLAQRGLPKSGNKAELAQRLHAALAEEQEMVLQDQMEARDELQRQFQESMMSSTSRCALCKHHLPSIALCTIHVTSGTGLFGIYCSWQEPLHKSLKHCRGSLQHGPSSAFARRVDDIKGINVIHLQDGGRGAGGPSEPCKRHP